MPRVTKYIPHRPHPKQSIFLNLTEREAFYGGAASGGKTDALLMGALQWVDNPYYAAILFRVTLAEHQLPGSLMARAHQWLQPWVKAGEVKWHGDTYTFTFPSGATLTFGYIRDNSDFGRYLSTEFQYIGFDELTTFKYEETWDELNGRLRKTIDSPVPLRIRGASNPGDVGHEWVKRKFIDPGTDRIPYIKATIDDNPSVDLDYEKALASIKDPVRREQLRHGDWDIVPEGKLILREWLPTTQTPIYTKNKVRAWDLAATEAERGQIKRRFDPDYTVGALCSYSGSIFTVEDVKRVRESPANIAELIRDTAERDGKGTPIWFEAEPGASGLIVIDHFRRNVLGGRYQVFGKHATGDKKSRVRAWAEAAQKGNLQLVEAPWNYDFIREAVSLGTSNEIHDDQMDAISLAFQVLTLGDAANFEEWRQYYEDEKKGVRRYVRPDQMSEEQYAAYLMERERIASQKVLERRAKEQANEH